MRYVGIDAHSDSLQVAITDEKGKVLEEFKVSLTKEGFKFLLHKLEPTDSVLIEATTNAFTIYDIISEKVKQVAVSNPKKTKVIAEARVKTDKRDARILATLLRLEAYYPVWVPPKDIREKRKIASLYYQLQKITTSLKNRIVSILQTNLIKPKVKDIFSKEGMEWLRGLELGREERIEMDICLETLKKVEEEKEKVEEEIKRQAIEDEDVLRLMQIPGINLLSGFIIKAEIGEIGRFSNPGKLASYAGLVPSIHQSNQKAYTGRITKEGRRLLRWILIQCGNVGSRKNVQFKGFYQRIRRKKGHNVAVVAVGRKMLVVIWYILNGYIYEYIEGSRYAKKILDCSWSIGKEINPKGARETLKEAFGIIGYRDLIDELDGISLNKIKKDKMVMYKLDKIRGVKG